MPYLSLSQGFLILILALVPAVIYLDATDHRIGRCPASAASMSAGAWAFWTLIPCAGPAIAFCYLLARENMIRLAAIHPVVVPARRRDLTCYLVLTGSLASYGLVAALADRPGVADGPCARKSRPVPTPTRDHQPIQPYRQPDPPDRGPQPRPAHALP